MFLPSLLSPMSQRYVWQRYFVALATALLAILLRALVEPAIGHAGFYVTVYVAVVFSALVCGLGPSVLTAVISTFGIVYWFVDPRNSFVITNRRDIHSLIACIVVCPVLIWLGETNRRKQLQINQARNELEQRVQERTKELSEALRERESAEEQLRRLTVRLMTVQDEERRHIARDLHDSAGQTLSAIKMSLAMLQRAGSETVQGERLMDDLNALTDEALQEIRTTSYLLHPPLLDECGFGSAARWFVEGFTKRSGIQVQCKIPEQSERFPANVELVMFRILQEALTNVHRHSKATSAKVSLRTDGTRLTFEVSDNGHGIPKERIMRFRESDGSSGVGLAGMRERVRELGGEMSIRSENTGTTISCVLSQAKVFGASTGNASAG
jgi:signal transduction histidine kinase